MKKLFFLGVVIAGVFALGLLRPSPAADAAGCFRCLPGGVTGPAWGFGATCQAATTDAINQASSQISCDQCGSQTVISLNPCNTSCTNAAVCFDPYNKWRVDVQLKYRCNVEICM